MTEKYMYWLSTLYRLGSRKQNMLLEHFGTAENLFNAAPDELRMLAHVTENNIRTITQGKNQIEYGLDRLEKIGISFISRQHKDFPQLLAEVPDPPVGLYYIGAFPDEYLYKVAVVGSRRCSEYGINIARKFSESLAGQNVVIVSGMARGIDGSAHRGALEGGGKTIAVLGCGVDICYPPENHKLRAEIIANGAVVSEYPPGVTPTPYFFPARNRIVSGLSDIILVVEASKKSGTQSTVDHALEQGRDVMSVPGSIIRKFSQGTNDLIKQGAEPATCAEDVLNMLETVPRPAGVGPAPETVPQAAPKINIAPEEKLVYDCLDFEPLAFDEIISRTGSQPGAVQYLLTMLELGGYAKKLPGMRYVKLK